MAAGPDDRDEGWDELVARLDQDVVRSLLTDAAGRNEDVARAVRLAAADPAERIGVLRAEVDRGLRTRRSLDYWESSTWAVEASPVVDALADAVASEPSRELVVLLERSVGHVVKVILRADDSNGMIGDLARQLLDLHERACGAGVADPIALARWMVRFTFDDQDFFTADPVRYAAALGDKGLAAYRRAVTKRADGRSSYAATYAEERLAVLDGDLDRIVSLLGGDLSSPHQYTRVVEAMLELGRAEDALAWARRGIDATSGWQVAKLYDRAAGVLSGRGDAPGVVELRREQHERMPSSSTYAALRAAATEVGGWDGGRDAARTVLAESDRGGFVDALLADGDSDTAWNAANADAAWDAGEKRWQRLAEAREGSDPAGALRVYLRLADTALVNAGRASYQLAARRLKAARRAATAAGLAVEFDTHVLALREQHRRRPTFIAILDKAGLP